MDKDTLDILTIVFGVLAVIYIFIKISMRARKQGGSMTTTMHAATHDLLDKDKQAAAEEVIERKADKKFDEEDSGKPKEE